MLRFIARLLGLLALAGAFASLIIDGTRSIAGSQISLTSLGGLLTSKLPAFEKTIAHIHPLLWDPATVWLLRLPVWVALGAVGLLLMWLARRRVPEVGYATRP